jgi:hypothetical protein
MLLAKGTACNKKNSVAWLVEDILYLHKARKESDDRNS